MSLPYFVGKQPTEWLTERISFDTVPTGLLSGLEVGIKDMKFIFDHVGGQGTNSPRRGVCVQAIPFPGVEQGHWTFLIDWSLFGYFIYL